MSNASAGSPTVYGYHAHVYYNDETFPAAEKLREALAATLPIELGQFSGEQVGPHPYRNSRSSSTPRSSRPWCRG